MRRFMLLLTAFLLGAPLLRPAHAQTAVRVVQAEATFEFGQQVTILATIQSAVPLEKVEVFLQSQGSDRTLVGEALLGEDGQVFYLHDLQREPLRAFAPVLYWFRITTQDGLATTSPSFSFEYFDNRFEWQTLEQSPFVVHWVEGSTEDAQRVLDTARQGLQRIQNMLPVTPPDRLDVYVYANLYDLQSSLEGVNRHLVAGHAAPDLGVVAVAIPSGPSFALDVQQRVPHELAHILLYRYLGPQGAARLPTWMEEGFASVVEIAPNPDYATALERATRQDRLIPLRDLCQSFPSDASGAVTAYAEAQSFVQYLYRRYGSQGLQQLILAYATGGGCQEAPRQALGEPLNALENDWLADRSGGRLTARLLPALGSWGLLLLVTLLPLFGAVLYARKR